MHTPLDDEDPVCCRCLDAPEDCNCDQLLLLMECQDHGEWKCRHPRPEALFEELYGHYEEPFKGRLRHRFMSGVRQGREAKWGGGWG